MGKKNRVKNRTSSSVAIAPQPLPKDSDKIVQTIFSSKKNIQQVPAQMNCLSSDDLRNLAEAAVNIWRAKQRIISGSGNKEVSPEMRNVLRRIDSALERLEAMHLTLKDHTGQPFVHGMALNVISSQPNSSLMFDRICETLKPTVLFRKKFIQAGDVIVEGPPSDSKNSEDTGKAETI
jgi:hypothetical protein